MAENENKKSPVIVWQGYEHEHEEKARDWYYSPSWALGGERPYDFCKRGEGNLVRDELSRIEHGVY